MVCGLFHHHHYHHHSAQKYILRLINCNLANVLLTFPTVASSVAAHHTAAIIAQGGLRWKVTEQPF